MLSVLLEGESLFNDASSIVLFEIFLKMAGETGGGGGGGLAQQARPLGRPLTEVLRAAGGACSSCPHRRPRQ